MAITVKHAKTSTIPDGADTDLVRPSDWNADHTLTGLGTMAEQNANNVAITGGSISGVTGVVSSVTGTAPVVSSGGTTPAISMAAANTSTNGYLTSTDWNTFNSKGSGDVVGPASATDNAVARYDSTTGKLIQNSVVTVGDTGIVAGVTELTASTKVVSPYFDANSSAGGALRNASGTNQIQWGGGGGNNVSIDVSTNLNGSNAQIDISPTGTGHVHIKPTGAGSLEIAPTYVGTIDKMAIGGITPDAGTFTNLGVTGTLSFDGSQGTSGQVLTSQGTGSTPVWTTPTTGTVTSVTGTAPIASSGGTTPAISISQATTSTNGYLSSTDWNTFNSKGSGTVTSVGGTGSVNGITLSGTVTSSGNLTLGGTLSNVDLTTQVTGTLPVANGGTGITSPGTSGNVLTSNGSAWVSSAPSGGGSWIYLSTVTASNSATADVETTFDSTYDMYAIVAVGVRPATDNQQLNGRLKIGGSYQTANYAYVIPKISSAASGTFSTASATSDAFIRLDNSAGNATGEGISQLIMYIANPASTSLNKFVYWTGCEADASTRTWWFTGSASYTASQDALTGVRFYFDSGNISSGSFRLYGIKNS